MFGGIPRDVWRHFPECLVTFHGIFGDIPRNVWRHSSEYIIPPIPRIPCILFPVPVFLVLYIALEDVPKKYIHSKENRIAKSWKVLHA